MVKSSLAFDQSHLSEKTVNYSTNWFGGGG